MHCIFWIDARYLSEYKKNAQKEKLSTKLKTGQHLTPFCTTKCEWVKKKNWHIYKVTFTTHDVSCWKDVGFLNYLKFTVLMASPGCLVDFGDPLNKYIWVRFREHNYLIEFWKNKTSRMVFWCNHACKTSML